MTYKEIQSWIAMIHNKIAEISVRGDDAIRVAEVLTECRKVVAQIGSDMVQKAAECDADSKVPNEEQ